MAEIKIAVEAMTFDDPEFCKMKRIKEPVGWWRVFHSLGCKGIAFYYRQKPVGGLKIRAEDTMFVDGTQPTCESSVWFKCPSCGWKINVCGCSPKDATLIGW